MTPPATPLPDETVVNPLLKLVIQFGVPAGIAVYLVYSMANGISVSANQTAALLQTHIAQSGAMQLRIEQQQASLDILVQLDKIRCLHDAKDVVQRSECYEASKR
jgi:hypothetical protein